MNIAKSIRISLAVNGMNQRELAKESGLSEATITNIMKGKTSPSVKTIEKIASAMDCNFDELAAIGND